MSKAQKGPVLTTVEKWVPGLRKGAGNNWLGFCPIHGEEPGKSKPSFSFNEATGQWNCFAGCGGGGLAQLLKRLKKSPDYIDRTVERLKPHLKETSRKKLSSRQSGLFETPYPLPERLLGLYEYLPVDLVEEGFSEEVLQANDIGFDPELGRITYPVRDLTGTLAGIVGKPVDREEGGGKYIVYEQELRDLGFRKYSFHNHAYLWRWEQVYAQVYNSEEKPPVYVTEGFKAALWLVQHGFPLTMALMGTSLSAVQQRFLERLGTRIVLCLDDDKFGRIGTGKIGYKMRGSDLRVMRYPYRFYNLQPDDLTAEELTEAVLNPYTITQWRRS